MARTDTTFVVQISIDWLVNSFVVLILVRPLLAFEYYSRFVYASFPTIPGLKRSICTRQSALVAFISISCEILALLVKFILRLYSQIVVLPTLLP